MFATLLSVAFLATYAISGVAAEITVSIPAEAKQCGPLQIKWSDVNAGAYSVLALNPEDPCGDELWDLGADHKGLSMTWKNVSLPAGTKLQFYVETESDDGWSGALTVSESDDFSCLPAELQPQAAAVASSTSASVDVEGTTLVLVPSSTASASPSSSASLTPVGAAGADSITGNENGAIGVQHISTPIIALGALVAGFALL